jgi:hypothetical protein
MIAEYVSWRLGGGIEAHFADSFYYRGELVPGLHFPVDGGDFVFTTEQGNEIEARAGMGLGGGLRFQEVFYWTENDLIQLALEPFVSYEPPAPGFFARFGFMLALDEQLGFGFDAGKVAAFRLTLGGKW